MKITIQLRNALAGVLFASMVLITPRLAASSLSQHHGKADLSRLVIIGDSLLADFQNGSLMASQQTNGISALIARQAGVSLSLPLIAEPGFPNVLQLINPGPPPQIVRASGVSTGRVDLATQPMNLAVPGHRVIDALETRPDFPIDSLTDLVLGFPGLLGGVSRSQIEWAEALQPTTIIIWIGNNDALNAAIAGDISALTPAAQFESAYSNLVARLAATGATLVVANIPDVTVIPYVLPVSETAAVFGVPLTTFVAALGVTTNDYLTLDNLEAVGAILQGFVSGPLTDAQVLDSAEVAQIRAATQEFNRIIAAQAAAKGAVLVDMNRFLTRLDRHGRTVEGQHLTTRFLGGIFSLDGVHPSNTGAALTANHFIHIMNAKAAAHIRPVNVSTVERQDPLVFKITHAQSGNQ
jgi:lysophospholipase L1-like esterase